MWRVALTLLLCAAACARPPVRPFPRWQPVRVMGLLEIDVPPSLTLGRDTQPLDDLMYAEWSLGKTGHIFVAFGARALDLLPTNLPLARDYLIRRRPVSGRDARWATYRLEATDKEPELFIAALHLPGLEGSVGLTVVFEAETPGGQALGLRMLETARLLIPPPVGATPPPVTSWDPHRHQPARCTIKGWDRSVAGTTMAVEVRDGKMRRVEDAILYVAERSVLTGLDPSPHVIDAQPGLNCIMILRARASDECHVLLGPGRTTIEITIDGEYADL